MLDKFTVLKEYFGHASFRHGQEQVVDAILQRQDALCVMPTGAGKSVCYQVPAMMFDGVTLVVSPLISLMKDQVNALTQNGIRAAYLNSSLTPAQYGRVVENIKCGAYKIIYVAPERLLVPGFLEACRQIKIDLLAIDEAHCISQWGQDFRPGYLKISDFVEALATRPTIAAFTATATAEVKDDIEYSLKLNAPFRITTGFDRPNLKFEVMRPTDKMTALLHIVNKRADDAGIVYCSTRKTVEQVADALVALGFSATMYHAGLSDDVRKRNQEDFVYDRKSIMVATNAFGMGIDKSNVSYVVHYNMPKDVESYYQEAGRAGRDGANADCILLYSPADVHTNQFLIEKAEPNPDLTEEQQEILRERDFERLKQMIFYSTTTACLRAFILGYFGERTANYCGNCSNCLTQFEECDVTEEAENILSCISETGERFGRKMICDVLRGSRSEKILRLGLNAQRTYGTMASYTELRIREILTHLEVEGYAEATCGEYPVLCLKARSAAILAGEERVMVKLERPKPAPAKKSKKRPADESPSTALFAELKALRRAIADEKGIPAYVVFSDAALVDMCQKRPATPAEFLEVSGVGKVKLALYGERFLALLNKSRPDEGAK